MLATIVMLLGQYQVGVQNWICQDEHGIHQMYKENVFPHIAYTALLPLPFIKQIFSYLEYPILWFSFFLSPGVSLSPLPPSLSLSD